MTTDPTTVRILDVDEQETAIETLTLAFAGDPYIRWSQPNPGEYTAWFPEFVRLYAGTAFDHGTAFGIGDCAAGALWLPPAIEVDEEALVEFFYETVPESKLTEAWPAYGRLQEATPEAPHWHLPFVGVDPAHQGRGYGSTLLAHVCEKCDEAGQTASLESGNPRNLSLYLRHGFELVDAIQIGEMPPLFPMVRNPATD